MLCLQAAAFFQKAFSILPKQLSSRKRSVCSRISFLPESVQFLRNHFSALPESHLLVHLIWLCGNGPIHSFIIFTIFISFISFTIFIIFISFISFISSSATSTALFSSFHQLPQLKFGRGVRGRSIYTAAQINISMHLQRS